MYRFLLFLSGFLILASGLRAEAFEGFNADDQRKIRIETLEAVKNLVPVKAGAAPVETTGDGGPYTLHGRLFGGSKQWALVEVSRGMAAAKWVKGKWVFSGTWNVPLFWKKTGPLPDETYSFVEKPPNKPFWLRKLWKDTPPFLILPTGFDRYHFGRVILRFDEDSGKIIDPGWHSIFEPEARGNYLCLRTLSPRKSWWSQTDYFLRSGNGFTFKASWKEDSENPEGLIQSAEVPAGKSTKPITLKVTGGYEISEGDKRIGSIEFLESTAEPVGNVPFEAEELWLFQALTGLPAATYGDTINGKDTGKVKAAMKRLHPVIKGEALRRRIGRGEITGVPAKFKEEE